MANGKRLLSLDILRGLDMFLLTVVGPLFWAVNKAWTMPEAVQLQFKHAWGGFTLWDIIMPLFIFMCGAAVPYALSKRLDEDGWATGAFWRHVFGRFVLLWFCGLLVQGRLATLDPLQISPYNNTLQTIAAGYLIAALVMLIPVRALRVLMPVIFVVAYGVLLHLFGDYTQEGNLAQDVEQKVLAFILPAGSSAFKTHGYTWFLTTLMFGAMTLCGAQCAEILRGKWPNGRKATALFLLGLVLLGAGWALVPVVPCIKHIYTVSFTCQAMGWCVLALDILYVLTDILNCRRGWWLFTLYGQCALTAYMAMHFFRPSLEACTKSITKGFPRYIDKPYMPLAEAIVTAVVLTVVLVIRRRLRGTRPAEATETSESASPQAPNADAAPGFKSQLMDGAIADRFKIPGVGEQTAAPSGADESGSQAAHVKTKLKIR
jgi:predicted acyltransferase